MSKLIGAVVGLGVGERHARTIAGCAETELKYVYDTEKEKADRLAGELSCVSVESYEDIVSDKEVGLIVIASYDDAHFLQVTKALKAGKHVFVEKPMCLTAEELRAIREVCDDCKELKLASNLVLRSAKLYRWLRESVSEGHFGEIFSVEGNYLWGRLWKLTEGWRKNINNYSIILGASVHLIDLMLWITGEKPVAVSSFGNNICTKNSCFNREDFASSIFRYDSGLIGNITANAACVHPHQHVFKVYGTKRTFIYDDQGPRFFDSAEKNAVPERLNLSALPDTKGDYLAEFIKNIVGSKKLLIGAKEEFDLMSVCLAAQEALGTGKENEVRYQ